MIPPRTNGARDLIPKPSSHFVKKIETHHLTQMFLYASTLLASQSITHALYGNFSSAKAHELVIVRNANTLQLLKPDEEGTFLGHVDELPTPLPVFGVIRCIEKFRMAGSNTDYLAVTSDSGKLVILTFSTKMNQFTNLYETTYGKTGCRRIVPGEYMALDPHGRALMIGAIEKQKFVYGLSRNGKKQLQVTSPLEAHHASVITLSMVGIDVGLENPVFACLEMSYNSKKAHPSGEKSVTFYELDLGLNTVTRKSSVPVAFNANRLVAVPGGKQGPGGVLICAENVLIYRNYGTKSNKNDVVGSFPRRKTVSADAPILIINSALHLQGSNFFFLMQDELGDVHKVTLSTATGGKVSKVETSYFETFAPCTSLCFMPNDFIFAASEFGSHVLYQMQSSGKNKDPEAAIEMETFEGSSTKRVRFNPRPLKNLVQLDEITSYAPTLDLQPGKVPMSDGTWDTCLYALCGRGSNSFLRVLRHGLSVNEMAVSPLPGTPHGVWTIQADASTKYIVVAFNDATLVLAVGDSVEEVNDSGFDLKISTIFASSLGDGMVQVHANGIRYINSKGKTKDWSPPHGAAIRKATVNNAQLAIAVSSGTVYYFELNQAKSLCEIEHKEFNMEISALDMDEGFRSKFLAVGSSDGTLRILGLDPKDCLSTLSLQKLADQPASLCLDAVNHFIFVGLQNGVLLRSSLDMSNGTISDTRTRYLGARPVQCFRTQLGQRSAILSLSSKPWISYVNRSGIMTTLPLAYPALEHAAPFMSEQWPQGCAAISQNNLRIFTMDPTSQVFNSSHVPLKCTPRKSAVHEPTQNLVMIETDQDPLQQTWKSRISVYNPMSHTIFNHIELEANEAATCMALVTLASRDNHTFLVVGTAIDMTIAPRSCKNGNLRIYGFVGESHTLALEHVTPIDGIPSAICPFEGRFLVGVGPILRIYDMGKSKCLRKCENKNFPSVIMGIQAMGDRIVVSDATESVHFVKYRSMDNTLIPFADDTLPRTMTASIMTDRDTVVGADKFGNFFVNTLPPDVIEDGGEDTSGTRINWWSHGMLNGAPNKLAINCQYFTGDFITQFHKIVLTPGGRECLLASTLSGALLTYLPITSKSDLEFLTQLELLLRDVCPPICGRDHLAYRSYFLPCKHVVDGDLCALFVSLSQEKQELIAAELDDRSPAQILKKLEEIQSNIAA